MENRTKRVECNKYTWPDTIDNTDRLSVFLIGCVIHDRRRIKHDTRYNYMYTEVVTLLPALHHREQNRFGIYDRNCQERN